MSYSKLPLVMNLSDGTADPGVCCCWFVHSSGHFRQTLCWVAHTNWLHLIKTKCQKMSCVSATVRRPRIERQALRQWPSSSQEWTESIRRYKPFQCEIHTSYIRQRCLKCVCVRRRGERQTLTMLRREILSKAQTKKEKIVNNEQENCRRLISRLKTINVQKS